ncbi:MAG TPA: DUF1501 domain-containing protein [Thermomicrobiales bacterium]|jgi:uncharacterized protein (DUF1501 family)
MPFTRRDFLTHGTLFMAMGVTAPTFLTTTARALAAQADACMTGTASKRILVVVQLGGGNDGLNSVIPYSDQLYYQARPSLGIAEKDVLTISDAVGFNPSLAPFKSLFDAKQLTLLQGVGYPNPNRSHFRSTDIWTSGVPDKLEQTGWLGRYIDAQCSGEDRRLHAVDIGTTVSRLFWTGQSIVPAISSLETFDLEADAQFPDDQSNQVETLKLLNGGDSDKPYDDYIRKVALDALQTSDELKRIAAGYKSTVEYPETAFADGLRTIAKIIQGDLGTRIFHITIGGFDTHAAQATSHGTLLKNVSEGVQAFMQDLEGMGVADDVLVMTFSEFGRRVKENASKGTDHGAAAPIWLVGGGLTAGIVGKHPSLSDLDDGDLKFGIDFRAVYGTILRDWLGADPSPIIGTGTFPNLGFVRDPAQSTSQAAEVIALAAD